MSDDKKTGDAGEVKEAVRAPGGHAPDLPPPKQTLSQQLLVWMLVILVGVLFGMGPALGLVVGGGAPELNNVSQPEALRLGRIRDNLSLIQGIQPRQIPWEQDAYTIWQAKLADQEGLMPKGEALDEIVREYLSEPTGDGNRTRGALIADYDDSDRAVSARELKDLLQVERAVANLYSRRLLSPVIPQSASQAIRSAAGDRVNVTEVELTVLPVLEAHREAAAADELALRDAFDQLKESFFRVSAQRTVSLLISDPAAIAESIAVTDEALAVWYEENQEQNPQWLAPEPEEEADPEDADAETADAETADAETADAETADAETADAETKAEGDEAEAAADADVAADSEGAEAADAEATADADATAEDSDEPADAEEEAPQYKALAEVRDEVLAKMRAELAIPVAKRLQQRFETELQKLLASGQVDETELTLEELTAVAEAAAITPEMDPQLTTPAAIAVERDIVLSEGADAGGGRGMVVTIPEHGQARFSQDLFTPDVSEGLLDYPRAESEGVGMTVRMGPLVLSSYQDFEAVKDDLVTWVAAQAAWPDLIAEAEAMAQEAQVLGSDGLRTYFADEAVMTKWATSSSSRSAPVLESLVPPPAEVDGAPGEDFVTMELLAAHLPVRVVAAASGGATIADSLPRVKLIQASTYQREGETPPAGFSMLQYMGDRIYGSVYGDALRSYQYEQYRQELQRLSQEN